MPSFLFDFMTAGMAATCAICIMHPVDVVKSRMQLQGEGGSSLASKQPKGVTAWLARIAREEGLRALYRGLPAAIALQFSVTATRFATYGAAQTIVGAKPSDPSINFIFAGLSGAVGAIVGNPWFAIKTRAQVFSTSSALTVGLSQHPPQPLLRAFMDIGAQSGLRGYMRGVQAFIPRVTVYGAAQLSSYDWIKHKLACLEWAPAWLRKNGTPNHLIASVGAAAASVLAIQPFDFLAARLQNQKSDVNGKGAIYTGVTDCLVKSVRAEGPLVVFKGFRANVLRFCPYTVLVFMFVEKFRSLAA